MHRRQPAVLLLALFAPVLADASVLSLQGNGVLLPETAGQQLTLLISGADFYTDSNFSFQINGGVGPAPAVTHVFGDTSGSISPQSQLAGSVWSQGLGFIGTQPNGTTAAGGDGLKLLALFITTPNFDPQSTSGVYVVLTLSTIGVPAGQYPVDLLGTQLVNGLDENFNDVLVSFELPTIVLTVVPEPSAYVLAAIGVVGLLASSRRRN